MKRINTKSGDNHENVKATKKELFILLKLISSLMKRINTKSGHNHENVKATKKELFILLKLCKKTQVKPHQSPRNRINTKYQQTHNFVMKL